MIGSGSKGSDKAFAELYSRYSKIIYSYCRSMSPKNVTPDDIFQETFIKFYKACTNGARIESVKAYLLTIARNLIRNNIKNEKEFERILSDSVLTIDENKNYDNAELMALIVASLDLLDNKYKEAFIYREFYNLPYNEIADILNISVTGAQTRVKRAKIKLADILLPYINEKI